MIISASRRTDIPAFYSEWFFNRIKEGYLLVRNPFNRKQVSKILLDPEGVDCIVFWTKDPEKMLDNISRLDEYSCYFQITINSYGKDVEGKVRTKSEILDSVKELSSIIGPQRIIWRYDPIFINDFYTADYHFKWFERIMKELQGFTDRCVISFLDYYRKTEKNTKHLQIKKLINEDKLDIAGKLSNIASCYGFRLEACTEVLDLSEVGIQSSKCIDPELISAITGRQITNKKDDTQRKECGCIKSVDIGQYNTCLHQCSYCYANFDHQKAQELFHEHDPNSPLICGTLLGDEKITLRKSLGEKKIGIESFEQVSFKIEE